MPNDDKEEENVVKDPDATKERYEGDTQERFWDAMAQTIATNIKRTYDEFQQESLETVRQQRTLFTKLLTDAQQNDNTRQNIANQALQNAVETANLTGKQAVRHGDIAIDRQWNLDEQGQMAAIVASGLARHLTDDHEK